MWHGWKVSPLFIEVKFTEVHSEGITHNLTPLMSSKKQGKQVQGGCAQRLRFMEKQNVRWERRGDGFEVWVTASGKRLLVLEILGLIWSSELKRHCALYEKELFTQMHNPFMSVMSASYRLLSENILLNISSYKTPSISTVHQQC